MTPLLPAPTLETMRQELVALRDRWGWFLALGIAMVALGAFAISWSCVVTLTVATVWLFGFLMLASGVSEIVNAFWVGRWSGMLVHLLIGLLYTVVGLMMIDQPEVSAIQLTLLIAIFLLVGGLLRVVFAVSERFPGWGWVLLNGAVTMFLGLVIYKQWPASGLWAIGLFVGIDLILNGWAWIMLALAVRKGPKLIADLRAAE
jgi:uncharacterized membrane protein HdeD (DUF308 family)